jgi:glycosyltransferase involved in cell wall biosynthesis
LKAIALVEAPGHVCARYRIEAFALALAAAGCELRVEAIARGVLGRMRLFAGLTGFDTVVLQRRLLPAYQLHFLRRRAKRLVFDFDDAVFCNDSYSPQGMVSPRRQNLFANTVRMADAILAGNDFLREEAIASGARAGDVVLIPTCIEPGNYQSATHHARDNLELVWIGSSSTLQGLEGNRALFEDLGARFPNLHLRIIADRFPDFARPPIVRKPWSSASEASELAAGDIGISWIPDDRWSRGKCGLKILQYYAAGLPVIANAVGVHPKIVLHGITGYLADNTEQWIDAIEHLADPAIRRRMGRAGRELVEAQFSVSVHASRLVDLVMGR